MFKWRRDINNLTVSLILLALFSACLIGSYVIQPTRPTPNSTQWFEGLLSNFAAEMFGAFVTFILLYILVEQRDKRQELKAQLIRKMGSKDNATTHQAVEELRSHDWFEDGSLRGANFNYANLQGVDLNNANLQKASLHTANLQWAYLVEANLRGSVLTAADLRLASLNKAELQGADLKMAKLEGAKYLLDEQLAQAAALRYAAMKDGTLYDGRFNLEGDIDMAHRRGVDINNPEAMAAFYDVSIEDYQRGQEWAKENQPRLRGKAAPDGQADQ